MRLHAGHVLAALAVGALMGRAATDDVTTVWLIGFLTMAAATLLFALQRPWKTTPGGVGVVVGAWVVAAQLLLVRLLAPDTATQGPDAVVAVFFLVGFVAYAATRRALEHRGPADEVRPRRGSG